MKNLEMNNNNIQIVNATPHAIILDNGTDRVTFPPSGNIARVTMSTEIVGSLNGFDIVKNIPGEVEGIPSYQPGVYYLVSALVLANSDREDLIAPDTNRAVRNDKGHIISVPGFTK